MFDVSNPLVVHVLLLTHEFMCNKNICLIPDILGVTVHVFCA